MPRHPSLCARQKAGNSPSTHSARLLRKRNRSALPNDSNEKAIFEIRCRFPKFHSRTKIANDPFPNSAKINRPSSLFSYKRRKRTLFKRQFLKSGERSPPGVFSIAQTGARKAIFHVRGKERRKARETAISSATRPQRSFLSAAPPRGRQASAPLPDRA